MLAKVVVIQHNKSHVTSISQVVRHTSEFNIVITIRVQKYPKQSNLKLTSPVFQIHASTKINSNKSIKDKLTKKDHAHDLTPLL
jgi:hypothetical protein